MIRSDANPPWMSRPGRWINIRRRDRKRKPVMSRMEQWIHDDALAWKLLAYEEIKLRVWKSAIAGENLGWGR